MANLDEVYPKKYLDPDQFKMGDDWALTIAECWVEDSLDFNKQPCKRVVVTFNEIEQQFPLSPNNAGRIKALYGVETDAYVGQPLVIGLEDEPKSPKGVAIRIKRPAAKVIAPPSRKPLPQGKPLPAATAHAKTQAKPAPASEREASDRDVENAIEAGGADNVNFY